MGKISNLAKEIQGTVNFFKDVLGYGDKAKAKYPNTKNITDLKETNWKKLLKYGFKVIDRNNNTSHSDFAVFDLQINPSELSQDENFSISLTPTQNGIVVEHNSIVFRDLIISGTTGVHPFKGVGGANRSGKVIAGEPSIESGYKHFQNFRNYIIAYADIKKDPANKNYQLVFINRKDNLNLMVEPLKFSLKRDPAKKTLYNYTVAMKVTGKVAPPKEDPKNIWEKIDDTLERVNDVLFTARGTMNKARDLLEQVERTAASTILEPMRQLSLFVKAAGNFGFTLLDLPGRLANDLTRGTYFNILNAASAFKKEGHPAFTKITLPANLQTAVDNGRGADLTAGLGTDGLNSINTSILNAEEQATFQEDVDANSALTRQFFEDLKEENKRIRDNAAEMFAVGDSDYDDYIGRTSTFTPSPIKQTTNEEWELLSAFDKLDKAISDVLATDNLFKNLLEEKIAWEEDQFDNNIDILEPNSVNEIILPADTTLEDLASQYLGSAERWPDIVVVNNLKYPYIEDTSIDPRVKSPGDRIFIPNGLASDRPAMPFNKIYPINQNLTQTERNLGIDMRLGTDFDFVITNSNDIDLIAAGANAGQAVVLKLSYEKGDLKYHPNIGSNLQIGEKTVTAEDIYDELISSILQDPRFESITGLQLRTEDNVLYVDINLKVKELNEPVPLTLSI